MGLLTILFSGLFKKYYQDRDWAVNHQVDHFKKSLFQFEDQLSTEIKYYQSITDTGGLVSLLNNGVDYHKSLEDLLLRSVTQEGNTSGSGHWIENSGSSDETRRNSSSFPYMYESSSLHELAILCTSAHYVVFRYVSVCSAPNHSANSTVEF